MGDWPNVALDFVRKRWPSKSAATVASLALGLLAMVTLANLNLATLSPLAKGFIACAFLGPWALWYLATRIPKHKKGTVGFGIAITYEKAEQAVRLRADFVDRLERLLRTHTAIYEFDVIEFPQHIAGRLRTREAGFELLRRARGHYLIVGHARSRIINAQPHHVLELDGFVRHSHVEQSVSDQLAKEFREVLPRSLMIAEENDLFSFQFTAQWIDTGARYIVGIAALISGDLEYAEQLFKGLESDFAAMGGNPIPSVVAIRNRLPHRLAEVYKERIRRLGMAYQLKRDPSYLRESEAWLEKLEEYDASHYSSLLHKAICAFVLRRDVPGARRALDKCKAVSDPTWRYSVAFLDAYEGDLDSAYRQYKRAFREVPSDPSVPIQTEEFMHLVLDEEPERGQLYYCLGLINERVKNDLAAAKRDYEQFLMSTSESEYPKAHKLVRGWIGKIDKQVRITTKGDAAAA